MKKAHPESQKPILFQQKLAPPAIRWKIVLLRGNYPIDVNFPLSTSVQKIP